MGSVKQIRDHLYGPRDQLSPTPNQFSQSWDGIAGKEGYGRPKEGSLTEQRGIKAHLHVHKEIEEMCMIMRKYGIETPDGWIITFGQMFHIYVAISDKVVGLLLRARKHGLVDFDGEMLFQRRDDNVLIKLLKEPRAPSPSAGRLSATPSPVPTRSSSPNISPKK